MTGGEVDSGFCLRILLRKPSSGVGIMRAGKWELVCISQWENFRVKGEDRLVGHVLTLRLTLPVPPRRELRAEHQARCL